MFKALLLGLGIPAVFRLFSGPEGDVSTVPLRKKVLSRRARRISYGSYPYHSTAAQRIRRVES